MRFPGVRTSTAGAGSVDEPDGVSRETAACFYRTCLYTDQMLSLNPTCEASKPSRL